MNKKCIELSHCHHLFIASQLLSIQHLSNKDLPTQRCMLGREGKENGPLCFYKMLIYIIKNIVTLGKLLMDYF